MDVTDVRYAWNCRESCGRDDVLGWSTSEAQLGGAALVLYAQFTLRRGDDKVTKPSRASIPWTSTGVSLTKELRSGSSSRLIRPGRP